MCVDLDNACLGDAVTVDFGEVVAAGAVKTGTVRSGSSGSGVAGAHLVLGRYALTGTTRLVSHDPAPPASAGMRARA